MRGTPDPEGPVESVGETDRTLGGIIVDPVPDASPSDALDYAESMMQPVDDESGHRPPPELVFDRDSQVDPYAQYTGEEQSGVPIGGMPDGLDADGSLIDPPEINVGGDPGTFMDTGSSSLNDDEEGLEDGGLENSDPASMDGKGGD